MNDNIETTESGDIVSRADIGSDRAVEVISVSGGTRWIIPWIRPNGNIREVTEITLTDAAADETLKAFKAIAEYKETKND